MDIFICSLFYTRERPTLHRASETQGLLLGQADPKARLCFPFSLFLVWARKTRRKLLVPALTQVKSHQLWHLCQQPGGRISSTGVGLSTGPGFESVYAMCAVCKLIFLLAATKIKDLAIYCKRHFQFHVVAFLSYGQGINPTFSLCL